MQEELGLKMPDSITGKGRLTPEQSAFEREEDQELILQELQELQFQMQ